MKKVLLWGIAAVSLLCGCKTQIVTVDVMPYDARVIANGVEYNNKSPLFIEANTGRQLLITAYKEGYRDRNYVIDYSLSTLGKIEACTSFLILPAIGLFFDNAWTLKENNISLVLEPVSEEAKAESLLMAPRVLPYGVNPDATQDTNARELFDQL